MTKETYKIIGYNSCCIDHAFASRNLLFLGEFEGENKAKKRLNELIKENKPPYIKGEWISDVGVAVRSQDEYRGFEFIYSYWMDGSRKYDYKWVKSDD